MTAYGTERIPKVLNSMLKSSRSSMTLICRKTPVPNSTSRLLLNFYLRHQYMRCLNSQPAMLSATTPISAIGQNWLIKRWNGMPSRNTPRSTSRK